MVVCTCMISLKSFSYIQIQYDLCYLFLGLCLGNVLSPCLEGTADPVAISDVCIIYGKSTPAPEGFEKIHYTAGGSSADLSGGSLWYVSANQFQVSYSNSPSYHVIICI